MDIRLSIIVATTGRPTLLDCLASISTQAREGDETLVMLDAPRHGGWGYVAHNRGLDAARGTHLIFLGEDDDFVPGGLDIIREKVAEAPGLVHLFSVESFPGRKMPRKFPMDVRSMDFSGELVPQGGIVIPRWTDRPLPRWKPCNSADRDFAAQAVQNSREAPIWHPEVVGRWRIDEWPGWTPRTKQEKFAVTDHYTDAIHRGNYVRA
jgi:hypothetical protein